MPHRIAVVTDGLLQKILDPTYPDRILLSGEADTLLGSAHRKAQKTMRPKLRIGLLLVSGMLLVSGLAYAYTDLANASDIFFSNEPSFDELMELEERTSQRLESERRAVQESIEMKQSLIEDLVAERISFAQTAREFQEINSMRPNLWAAFRLTQPGKTDQERVCDQILSYVRGMLKRTQEAHVADTRIAAFEKTANDYLQAIKVQ